MKNRTNISPRYVREVKRIGRIGPGQEWGKGTSYRCFYKVRESIPIEVGHQCGRPSKKTKYAI